MKSFRYTANSQASCVVTQSNKLKALKLEVGCALPKVPYSFHPCAFALKKQGYSVGELVWAGEWRALSLARTGAP